MGSCLRPCSGREQGGGGVSLPQCPRPHTAVPQTQLIQMVVWMLQHRLLVQLHTYVCLMASPSQDEPRLREDEVPFTTRVSGRSLSTPNALSFGSPSRNPFPGHQSGGGGGGWSSTWGTLGSGGQEVQQGRCSEWPPCTPCLPCGRLSPHAAFLRRTGDPSLLSCSSVAPRRLYLWALEQGLAQGRSSLPRPALSSITGGTMETSAPGPMRRQ